MIKTGLGIRRALNDPWRLALLCLPQPLVHELWHLKSMRKRRPDLETARDVRVLRPQEGVVLEVYWANVPVAGSGPAASLFVLEEEVLRLDCFGGERGHMHVNPKQDQLLKEFVGSVPRIYFHPGAIARQIERAAFEVTHNTKAAISTNMIRRVRRFQLDQAALREAASEMVKEMHDLCALHGAQPGPAPRQGVPRDRPRTATAGG